MEKCFSANLAKAGDDLIEWDDLVCDGRLLNRDDNESYAENLLSLSHLATRVPAGLASNSIFIFSVSFVCTKSMTPRRGYTILFRSSQQLPRLRLGPLKGFLS